MLGRGGVKFLHIERKITSVVHSHPPSHYICAHASGWLLVMFATVPTVRKTKLSAFRNMLLHCTAHAEDNFIAFLSYEIERLSFLGRPYRVSVFGCHLCPGLGTSENLQSQCPRGIPSCEALFLGKKLASGRGWPHHIYKSTITCETKTRQDSCDAQFPWKQIRNRGVVGRITDEPKTHVTREKTRNLGAG